MTPPPFRACRELSKGALDFYGIVNSGSSWFNLERVGQFLDRLPKLFVCGRLFCENLLTLLNQFIGAGQQ